MKNMLVTTLSRIKVLFCTFKDEEIVKDLKTIYNKQQINQFT